jgi:hypothetical protein
MAAPVFSFRARGALFEPGHHLDTMGDLEAKYQPLASEGPSEDEKVSGGPDPEGFKDVADYVEHRLPNNRKITFTRRQGNWVLIRDDRGLELRWEASHGESIFDERQITRSIMGTNHMRSIMSTVLQLQPECVRFIMNNGHYVDVTVQKCTITFRVSGVYVDVCEIEPKEQKQVKMSLAETRSEAKVTGEGARQDQTEGSGTELRQRAKQNAQSCG